MNEEVTIVLISHKSRYLISNFIKNIYDKFEIIIIDNANDKKLELEIKHNYPNVIIKLIENNGYGAAINYASKLIKKNYFLICNPDVEGLNEKNIQNFITAAKSLDDKFSSLGPRYINVNRKSHVQSDPDKEVAEMMFISGACMFFKKEKFDQLGGFDENFFLYFEESDFCLRSYKINKNYQINKIKLKHYNGTSVSTKNAKEKNELQELYTWHFIWSKFYYYKKHYSFILAFIYFIPIILRIIFRISFYLLKDDKININKYKTRWSGLINSIKGNKSYKRLY